MAFRARGHEAYSCDIQHCALWNHLEWHIGEDAVKLIRGGCTFETADGQTHRIEGRWDMLIAHPPCTYLTSASAIRLFNPDHTIKSYERLKKGCEARELFFQFLNADCRRIAIENPTPLSFFQLPQYTQVIEPFQFGEPWRKRTCLWLKGLPALQPTEIVQPMGLWVGSSSKRDSKYILKSQRNSKTRSKTFHGIAEAMAEQWGGMT